MSKTEMPAAEVNSYELAFHVLPTVAEGEVATVFQNLKDVITKHGGTITTEEAPARIDLAFEIIKYLEGRNRKFSSAHFGWVRFTADPAAQEEISEAVEGVKELLRYLVIKLTRVEEENPFYYHEAMAAELQSETIEIEGAVTEKSVAEKAEAADESKDTEADTVEKSEKASEDGEESKEAV